MIVDRAAFLAFQASGPLRRDFEFEFVDTLQCEEWNSECHMRLAHAEQLESVFFFLSALVLDICVQSFLFDAYTRGVNA